MAAQCVVALYESFDEARAAILALEEADYPRDQVSFVTHSVKNEMPKEDALQYGDKTERNAAKGAGVGGLLGLLLGSPLLAVSGVGAVLIAGPIATGLAGAIVGGFLGAMSGWGVHVDHVRRYEKEVAAGSLLVVAQGDPQQVAQAEQILEQTGAQEVHMHAETSADTVDR